MIIASWLNGVSKSMLFLCYFITDFYVGKHLSSYVLVVYLTFRMHQLNQPHLVDIDSPRFFQNFEVFDRAPLFWNGREFQRTWLYHSIYLVKCRIKCTTLVMNVIWYSQQHTCFLGGLPSIDSLDQNGSTIDRIMISEWPRLHRRLK